MTWTPPWYAKLDVAIHIFIIDSGLYDFAGPGDPDLVPPPSASSARSMRSALRQELERLAGPNVWTPGPKPTKRGSIVLLSARTQKKDRVLAVLRAIGIRVSRDARVKIMFRQDPNEDYEQWYMRAAVEAARQNIDDPGTQRIAVYGLNTDPVRAALRFYGFEVA